PGIRHGNMIESQKLRARETVLEALTINCKDTRMLSARTGEKLRAISEVTRKGRRVKDLRRLMNYPDVWMEAYLHIQGNKGALTRGTTTTTMMVTHQRGRPISSNSSEKGDTSRTQYEESIYPPKLPRKS